jgi:AcrR family transcriptional regulator
MSGSKRPIALKQRRRQADRSASTRRALLDAATWCLADLGYAATTVEVIANKANVSRGAIQHHFGSRDGLLSAIIDDLGLQLIEDHEVSSAIRISDRVDAAIDRHWATLNSQQFRAAMQIWLSMRSNKELFGKVSDEVAKIERHLDGYWFKLFAGSGLPRNKIATLRHIVFSALRGLAIRNLYRKDVVPWRAELNLLKKLTVQSLAGRRPDLEQSSIGARNG